MKKPRILVVDDTQLNLMAIEKILGDTHDLILLSNSSRALEVACKEPFPDLILLDVVMPDMDGYTLCKCLKAMPKTRQIPVIFITSLTDERNEEKGFEFGAVDYITKPFCDILVQARVRTHLELKRHQDELELLVNQRTHELNQTQDATIYGLALLAEFRDPETGSHIQRVQKYCYLLADYAVKHCLYKNEIDESVVRLITKSAPLHDIGKVGVPDHILFKPGPLTETEYDEMKKHAGYGRDILAKISMFASTDFNASGFLNVAREIAGTHHEKWDGTGYQGMQGLEIPIAGRVVAIADVYDALTSKRPYKNAMSHKEAMNIMLKGDNRTRPEHFDPQLLKCFTEVQDFVMAISDRRDWETQRYQAPGQKPQVETL